MNLLTVKQFSEQFPAFPNGALRNYIFFEDSNGMKELNVIKRIKSKILIDVDAFFIWVEEKSKEARS